LAASENTAIAIRAVRSRNIGDFLRWKDHDTYKQSFDRVLRDLTRPTTVA
jgi:hypothetical protein